MRIGLVCPYNYFRPGGVQAVIRELAIDLEKRGHYVRIIAPKPRKLTEQIDDNVLLIGGSTELNTPMATKSDLAISVSNEKIDALLAEQKFDVLHFHEPIVPMLALQLSARANCAMVATMHATMPEGTVSKSFQALMKSTSKFIKTRMDVLTTVSSVSESAAQTYLGKVDMTIIPNAIRLGQFKPKKLKKNSKTKTIVSLGRLEKRKGVRYLLEAYALLRQTHDDVNLIIASDGDLRSNLEAMVTKHKIPDVTFVGFVSEAEKINLLQTADLYCSPAIYGESFGIVLLEAMAAGTVTVAGNNPGYASVMQGRGRLSLVNPKSTEDFAQRLELMLYDQAVRQLWLDWATKYVKQFDYPKIVDQYEAVYNRAVAIHKSKNSNQKLAKKNQAWK